MTIATRCKGEIGLSGSRTENVMRNAWVAFVTQIITILLNYVNRTVFIKILVIEYLGLNGLCANVLWVLSFAELGIGNALIFSMYKPLGIQDRDKLKSLMALYKKAYSIIGTVIFFAGLALVPFLNLMIKEPPDINENIYLIYILFLVNSTISYFFVYKRSIIIADQKNYIVLLYQQAFIILQIIGQIIFLYFTHEYVYYLVIHILCTFLNNIFIARKADKLYPYLKEGKAKPLIPEERKDIFRNIRALFLNKIGSVVLNGTDNIIISAFIGLTAVGLYSNYYLVLTAFTMVIGQIMSSFTASVGNLNALSDVENKERVFYRIFFITAWIYGFFSIGLYLLLNPFIKLWLGEDFLLSAGVVFSIVLHFYINGMHFAVYTYRITMGLFVHYKYTPIFAAVMNIILSIVMAKYIGLMGVFLATSISRFLTSGIVDPVLVYRKIFNKNPIKYYIVYFIYAFITILLYFIFKIMLSYIPLSGITGFIVKGLIITVLFNLLVFLLIRKTKDFQNIKIMLMKKLRIYRPKINEL